MAESQNNEELLEAISLTKILTEETKNLYTATEEGEKIWKGTNDLVEQYNKTIEANKDIYEDQGDLLKQQLKDTEKLIVEVAKKSKLNADDKTAVLEDLKAQKNRYKELVKQRAVQDAITSKSDAMLDGLESQIKKVPLVGDILASTLDFDGLKKEMGGILSGVTENFIKLTKGSMSTGAAISKSFGTALPLLKQFGKKLLATLGPIMLVVGALYLIKKAFDFDKETTQLAKDLGVSVDEARDMEQSFNNISASSSNLNVNTKSLVEAQKQLSSATGLTAEFSEQMLTDQIQLTKFMGLSGDEAANFQKIAIGNNQTARELQREIAGSVEEFNNATGASVSLKDVVQDIAKLPADIRVGFKGTTAELAQTVALAKVMGTTLEKSVAAANKTLDIETSLKNEAQARILTGVSINNNAIRAAQLAGDQKKVLELQRKELEKIGDIGDYLPYQQEALADAMGMSVEEIENQQKQMKLVEKLGVNLTKATLDQIKANSKLSDEEKEQLIKQKEQVSAQEKLSQIAAKFKDMLNSIVAGPLGQIAGLLLDVIVPAFNLLNFLLTPVLATFQGISGILTGNIESLSTMQTILGGIVVVMGTFYATMKGIRAIQTVINTLKATENNLSLKGIAIAIREKAMKYGGAIVDIIKGAWSSFGAIPVVGGILAAAAAAAGIGYLATQSSKKGDDVFSPGANSSGYGDRVLTGPEGSIALNNKDSVIAGTNLFGDDSGNNQMSVIFQQLISEVRGLRQDIQLQPIMVTVDGKVVSEITRVQSKQASFRK